MVKNAAIDLPLVLIVEDSRVVLEELVRSFEETGEFRIIKATNLAEALELMDASGPDIFFAILDVTLPDAPHGEVIDCARERDIPVIVFTANLDAGVRDEILSKEVIDYVVKDRAAFTQLVDQGLRLKRNRGIKALVVDDSVSFRGHTRQLLQHQMLDVLEATSGAEALDIFETNSNIALAVIDHAMPGMTGLELVKKLRTEHGPETLTIIGVSSRFTEPLSAWYIKSGANDFLNKPFTDEEFNCRVLQHLDTQHMVSALKKHDEDKNRFLGIVAHDLRTPINGVSGFIDLLLDDSTGPLSEDQRELLEIIQTANDNMLVMVNDLLDISVIHSGKLDLRLAKTDMAELVQERVRIQSFAASQKNIVFATEYGDVPALHIDAQRMAQMVDNLLSNAIKYSPHGTTTRITLGVDDENFHFVVADQGPGITPEDQARLFKSFSRTGNQPTGDELSIGLGLMIVRSIVEAHFGRVWVESPPGKGAEFHVTLPLEKDS